MNNRTFNNADWQLSWNLQPILDCKYFKPIETELMFVGKINNKKEICRLMKELTAALPFNKKSFLKRVRRTADKNIFDILLRPVTEEEKTSNIKYCLKSILGNINFDTSGLMETITIEKVPINNPLTNKQYKEALTLWPLQCRHNRYIEEVLEDKLFKLEEKRAMESYMKMCIKAAKFGDVKVGCVIVDPETSEVVAIAHDRRHHHPVQHSVMVAIDLVAKHHGGGAWNIGDKNLYHLPLEKIKAQTRLNVFRNENLGISSKVRCVPYLCTGYDIYISREPCVMCAMSLVHSRIRRVFYGCKIACGALGTCLNIHTLEGLNHHYEVWSGILENECLTLTNMQSSSVSATAASLHS